MCARGVLFSFDRNESMVLPQENTTSHLIRYVEIVENKTSICSLASCDSNDPAEPEGQENIRLLFSNNGS